MFVEKDSWFAWFPVIARTSRGKRMVWLETVQRERIVSPYSSGPFRYYT